MYYFFYVIFKKKWLIILTSILGVALTVLGSLLYTPLYKATTKILVRANVTQEVVLFKDLYQQVPKTSNIIPANNFIELAKSEAFARIIVDEFQLDKKLQRKYEDPQEFRDYFRSYVKEAADRVSDAIQDLQSRVTGESPKESKTDYTAKAVKKFLEDMTDIEYVPESDIINITIWGESPKEAENISKELANMVIQNSISSEQNAASYGYNFSQGEVEKAERELTIAEQNLNRFKRRWDVSKIEKQKEIKLNELDEVERNLISVSAELSTKKARMQEGMRQINEQKKKLTSLDSYQNLLNENVSLNVDVSALKAKKQEYELARKQIKAALSDLVEKELELTQLERDVDLENQLFTKLSSKQDELNVQRASKLTGIDLRLIDTPKISVTAEPDLPNWDLNLGIGIPASVLLAIGFVFLLELSNESFWVGDQIEKRLNIPLLGTIREVKGVEEAE
jgi:uncharacterized protein involved in exopolysaccharide biosynthesis